MLKVLKRSALVLAAALVLILLFLVGRVVFYRQTDDRERVDLKQAYLERIATLTGGVATGPNFVVILFDDLGYGDIGAYGSLAIRTPNLDRLARGGVMLTHAYSASPSCSGSRAGLMTGRYPVRSGLDHVVQFPGTWKDVLVRLGGLNRRLPAEEVTISEVLSAAGYATGIVGKWHLGDRSPSLPGDRGFDTFYGLLFSNDQGRPSLWHDREVVEPHPIRQETLTRRYTRAALEFIESNRDRPFFLYLPHTFPHRPLRAAEDRRGRSPGGLYGDVVEELDWSVGEVLASLERYGLERDTLVIVTSDNGPWFQGSAGRTRGRKFDAFEGGMRVPLIASWPGRIQAGGSIDEPVIGIDLFPTILELTNLPPPEDRVIDGRSLIRLLEGGEVAHHEAIFFHQIAGLKAVRSGRYKYHDRRAVPFGNPQDWPLAAAPRKGPWLFDLRTDPDESYDLAERHPRVALRLDGLLREWERELSDNPRGWK